MRTTRSTTRKSPVTALLTALATLLGIIVLGAVGPATAHAQSAGELATGLHISDGRLLEGNGNDFIMRGVNHAHTWYPGETQSLADIKALGANTVRVVLSDGHRWSENSPADVAAVVAQCKANRLICVLEVHDTTGYGEDAAAGTLDHATYWVRTNATKPAHALWRTAMWGLRGCLESRTPTAEYRSATSTHSPPVPLL